MKRFLRKSPSSKDSVKQNPPTFDSTGSGSAVHEGGAETQSGWDLRLSTRLVYLGCKQISEAKSLKLLYDITKQLKERERQEKRGKQVVFELHALNIVVVDAVSTTPDLNIPLMCVSMCANDKSKSVADCFAIVATAKPGVHECHVFQCKSMKEVQNVVQNVALGFKLLGRTRRLSDQSSNPSPAPSPILPKEMRKISEESTHSHRPASPRPSSGATSLSSYFSSSSSNVNRLSDQSSLLGSETKSGSIHIELDAGLVPPVTDAIEEELHLRVDRIVVDRERLQLVCRTGDPAILPDESPGFISALFYIGKSDVQGLARLVDGGLSVNQCDSQGRTLLHFATACGNEDVVRVLLERNANVDIGDNEEITPLHMAAAAGDKDAVQLLISSGANVNVTDTCYRSPLHYCSFMCGPDFSGHTGDFVQCCYLLLENGAQIDNNDLNGVKPVDVFWDLSEMRSRLIDSACEGLSSMTEVPLVVFSEEESTGAITPLAGFESNFSSAVNTLDRGRSKRFSSDSSATLLSSSSTNSLKRSPPENGSLASPTPVSLSRPLSILSESDRKNQERPVVTDLISAGDLKPYSSMSLPLPFRSKKNSPLKVSATLRPRRDLTEHLDQETKDAFKDLDTVVSQSFTNLEIDDDDDYEQYTDSGFHFDRSGATESNGEVDFAVTPLVSTPERTLCSTRSPSEDDMLAIEVKSAPTSRHSSLERESVSFDKTSTLRPFSLTSYATNNSSPSSETVTPESSSWNTLDSSYHVHTTRNRDAQLSRIRDGTTDDQGSGSSESGNGIRNQYNSESTNGVESHLEIQQISSSRLSTDLSYHRIPSQRWSLASTQTSPEMSATSTLDSSYRSHNRAESQSSSVRLSIRIDSSVTGALHQAKSLPRINESATDPNVDAFRPTIGNPNSVPGSECSSALTSTFSTLDSTYRGNRARLTSETSLQKRLKKASKSLQRMQRSSSVSTVETAARKLPPQRRRSLSEDQVSLEKINLGISSLQLLVTLSWNRECHEDILSRLCIEKNASDLVHLARMPVLGEQARDCIATLIHRLFEVEGSVSRYRALRAGLFAVVLELLDDLEPVQSTCLSISESILQGDENLDYMAVVASSVDPDGLLRLVSFSQSSVGDDTNVSAQINRQGRATTVRLRILSAVSAYSGFRKKLISEQAIRCLKAVLRSPDEENVTFALATIANVAQLTESHQLLSQLSLKRCLLKTLEVFESTRARFHAMRALIYCGHQEFPGLYLFQLLDGIKNDTKYGDNFTEGEAFGHVRGISLERAVSMMTSQSDGKWAGIALSPGPMRAGGISLKLVNREQTQLVPDNKVIEMILATCKSFVEPPILLRLLLHRFRDPKTLELFDAGRKRARRSRATIDPPIVDPYAPLPNHHMYIMRILDLWLDKHSQDYREYPEMKREIKALLKPMRRIGGPYVLCATKLRQLCHDVKKIPESLDLKFSGSATEHAHDRLYEKCRDIVTSGELAITTDQAIFFAGIQSYIEDMSASSSDDKHKLSNSTWSLFGDRTLNTKLKHCLPPDVKGKAVSKAIRVQHELHRSQRMSDRNAKHLYINRVHELPQYGCKFFSVKEIVAPSAKRSLQPRRILGISTDVILLLEERSKEIMKKFAFKSLKQWKPVDSDTCLVLTFGTEQLIFVAEDPGYIQKINNHIWWCVEEVDWMNIEIIDASPWGRAAEEQGQWGSSVLVATAKTPKAKQRASSIRTKSFSNTRDDITPSSSASSSPSSSSHHTPTVTPRGTPTDRTPVDSLYDPLLPARTEHAITSETITEEQATSDIAVVMQERLTETTTEITDLSTLDHAQYVDSIKPRLTVTTVEDVSFDELRQLSLVSLDGSQSSLIDHDQVDELHQNSPSTSCVSIEHPHSDSGLGTHSSASRTASCPTSELTTPPMSFRLHSESMVSTSSAGCSSHTEGSKLCDCPPDPDVGEDFDFTDITAKSLLEHPKELARQITLIDHAMFCHVTFSDCLRKVGSTVERRDLMKHVGQSSVEMCAHRFNQLSNWVIVSILDEETREERVVMLSKMIQVARQCLHYRNYNAMVAMVVAGLGSSPIRRLKKTWQMLEKDTLDLFLKMEHLVRIKNNYKNYRQYLRATNPPAVPYFGLYLKDLTFIEDGNPHTLKGGLVNWTKRHQIFAVLFELHTFQSSKYNIRPVPPIIQYLLSHQLTPDINLHEKSRSLETTTKRTTNSSAGTAGN